jgi:hypothetical protein
MVLVTSYWEKKVRRLLTGDKQSVEAFTVKHSKENGIHQQQQHTWFTHICQKPELAGPGML